MSESAVAFILLQWNRFSFELCNLFHKPSITYSGQSAETWDYWGETDKP